MLDRRRTFEPGGISDFPERGSEALFVDMRANGVQHFALAVGQGGLVRLLLGGEGMVLTSGLLSLCHQHNVLFV